VPRKKEDNIRETTFYCASVNIRSLNFELKCAVVAAHTLKNVVFQMLSSLFIRKNLRVSVPPSSSCLSAAGIEVFKRRRHKKLLPYKNFANVATFA
jgi:hypothetical protein